MCMSCNNTRNPLKKISIVLAMVIGIGAITYFVFSATNNPVFAASIPLIMSFAACPLMCAAMGGSMWLMNRYKKRNNLAKETKLNPIENDIEKQPVEHNKSVLEDSPNTNEKGKEVEGIHNITGR